MNKPTEQLLDCFHDLHGMEARIARSLPVLSGSVMNVRLRKLLTDRAFRTRDRRDWLADQLCHHGDMLDKRMCPGIRVILAAGNKDLAVASNPFTRDLVMIRHCMRIEQHAIAAYGIVSRLVEGAGFPAEMAHLASFLSELKVAGIRLQSIESELSPAAILHRSRADRLNRRPQLPAGNRTMTSKPTKIIR